MRLVVLDDNRKAHTVIDGVDGLIEQFSNAEIGEMVREIVGKLMK